MPSLFMGFVNWGGVPNDEKAVRNTATPYAMDKPAAMMDDMPTMQEFESDPDPSLGLAPRQLASKWHEGERGIPSWMPRVAAVTESTRMINSQVSTSGTAAQREAAGETNKNLSYAVGIEPVGDLREGGKMGNDYFVRNQRVVQDGSDNTMMSTPPGFDQSTKGLVAARGKQAARDAAMADMYNAFWNGGN
jgi:hypothetical protein